jgi:hypothetical protein
VPLVLTVHTRLSCGRGSPAARWNKELIGWISCSYERVRRRQCVAAMFVSAAK